MQETPKRSSKTIISDDKHICFPKDTYVELSGQSLFYKSKNKWIDDVKSCWLVRFEILGFWFGFLFVSTLVGLYLFNAVRNDLELLIDTFTYAARVIGASCLA